MSRPIRVLNVAEKNSVAREVSRILSRNHLEELNSAARYCKVFRFPFNLGGRQVEMTFSSVMGHLLELEFDSPYNTWNSCDPVQLYQAPVSKRGNNTDVKRNLEQLSRNADWLVLWLDCDREGENIAFEVIQVCRAINPRLQIFRARFSALIEGELLHAVHNLVPPNENDANAVDVRQEIDLRIGASFTRLQTKLLQDKWDWSQYMQDGRERMLVSYGPCQFPTLGLIVQREWEIQSHVYEDFWSISVTYRNGNETCEFSWSRGRLFDEAIAGMYHRMCLANPIATVVRIDGAQKTKWAPSPLSTLEMQKRASQWLRISGDQIMKIAEELYQGGFISYPRTETDCFAANYDLMSMIRTQADTNAPWAGFAQRLANGGMRWPRPGGHDDKAHPPIHPIKPFPGDQNPNKARLYEFIVRHFLACCAHDAEGQETKITIAIAGETFTATGLMVTARNWLEVYTYTKWGGSELPRFEENQTFQPANIPLKQGRTEPPPRMKESDLLSKMDSFGIGTDATVADHIAKQLERGYATKDDATLTFSPTPLGESLISSYRKMGLDNLWTPTLRGTIENNINLVAQGTRSKESVLQEAIDAFRTSFQTAQAKAAMMVEEVGRIVFDGAMPGGGGGGFGGDGGGAGQAFGVCTCGGQLLLHQAGGGRGPTLRCTAHPGCNYRQDLPTSTTSVQISAEQCHMCAHGQVQKLHFVFNMNRLPPQFRHLANAVRCGRCDPELHAMLQDIGPVQVARAGARGGRGGGNAAFNNNRGRAGRGGRGNGQGRGVNAGNNRGRGNTRGGGTRGGGGRGRRGGRRV